jgi:hypothetical protein
MPHNGDIVFPFSSDSLRGLLGNSYQGNYLLDYLSGLNAKTCILEGDYIDKDYMIDYQKFYSRSFFGYKRITKRIHFFATDFSPDDFEKSLENSNVKDLQESYLGFAVIKPIEDSNKNPLIGRSILKTCPSKAGDEKRFFISRDYCASLFGIPLTVESLPFQVQDQAVGGCATVALWSAIQHLADIFGTPKHSPAEITEIATSFPSEFRAFPSTGLTWEQMINYVRSTGLDIETILCRDDNIISIAVKAYIKEMKLPLIGLIKLPEGEHAVVISGYQCDSRGKVTELYVHDDQIGPYSRVKPDGGFKFWKRSFKFWKNERYRKKIILEKILVPVYSKIRLTFPLIYPYYMRLSQVMKEKSKSFGVDLDFELHLTSVEEYKEFLLKNQIKDKIKILTYSLPRFIWIIRAYGENLPLIDWVHDGTMVDPRKSFLISISYPKNLKRIAPQSTV